MMLYPRATISPVVSGGQSWPVSMSIIFASILGIFLPTVDTRTSMGSSVVVMVMPGEDSVCPYTITISFMFISKDARFINSIGQGDPAMIPVRRVEKSYLLKSGCSIIAMNMVGT